MVLSIGCLWTHGLVFIRFSVELRIQMRLHVSNAASQLASAIAMAYIVACACGGLFTARAKLHALRILRVPHVAKSGKTVDASSPRLQSQSFLALELGMTVRSAWDFKNKMRLWSAMAKVAMSLCTHFVALGSLRQTV
eukprot:8276327-Karenia_brevis.AAC.1